MALTATSNSIIFIHVNSHNLNSVPIANGQFLIDENNIMYHDYNGTRKIITLKVMEAATGMSSGKSGLVPAPTIGSQSKFLRGDGTWQTPTNTTYNAATTSTAGLMSAADKASLKYLEASFELPKDHSKSTNSLIGSEYSCASGGLVTGGGKLIEFSIPSEYANAFVRGKYDLYGISFTRFVVVAQHTGYLIQYNEDTTPETSIYSANGSGITTENGISNVYIESSNNQRMETLRGITESRGTFNMYIDFNSALTTTTPTDNFPVGVRSRGYLWFKTKTQLS